MPNIYEIIVTAKNKQLRLIEGAFLNTKMLLDFQGSGKEVK